MGPEKMRLVSYSARLYMYLTKRKRHNVLLELFENTPLLLFPPFTTSITFSGSTHLGPLILFKKTRQMVYPRCLKFHYNTILNNFVGKEER